MANIDFPADPGSLTPANYWTAPNGIRYFWNGARWRSSSADSYIAMSGTGTNSVSGNISLADSVKLEFGAADDLAIYHDGTNNYIDFDTGELRLSVAGTAKMTLDSSGNVVFPGDLTINTDALFVDASAKNVGIGTASPVSLGAGFTEAMISGANEGAGLQLQDTDGNVKLSLFTSDVSGAGVVRTITNHPLTFRTNNTEAMRLDSSGSLLIGGTLPSSPNITLTGSTGAATFAGYVDCTRDAADAYGYAGFGPGGSAEKAIFVNRSGDIVLELYDNYTQPAKVSISSSGAATFAGTITAAGAGSFDSVYTGSNSNGGGNYTGAHLASTGVGYFTAAAGSTNVFSGYTTGSTTPTCTITAAGAATFAGKITLSNSSGIQFGSSDTGTDITSQTLDDYEEGTWTPVLAGETTAGSMTGTTYGIYTKIGRQVSIGLRFASVSLSGASGAVNITGLPFPGSGNEAYSTSSAPMTYGITFDATRIQAFYHSTSGSSIHGIESRQTSWLPWDVSNFSGPLYLQFSMTYQTTS